MSVPVSPLSPVPPPGASPVPPASPTAEVDAPLLGLPGGQIVGWLVLVIVNAIVIAAAVRVPRGHMAVRVFHHLYDAGQLVALGVSSAAAVGLWLRFGPRRRIWSYVAIGVATAILGVPLLSTDLTGLASPLVRVLGLAPSIGTLLVGAGAGMAAVAFVGRLLARPWLWLLGAAVGTAASALNHFVLENDYPGVHLYIAVAAATLIGASIGAVRGSRGVARSRRRERVRAIGSWARAPLALFGAWALIAAPSNAVVIELMRLPGAVVIPVLARLRTGDFMMTPDGASTDPWLSIDARSDVPPSSPALLGPDRIVIVIAVDALRADVASGKYASDLPALDALRRESIEFTEARSPASATIWTLASLFSSRYYSELYWTVKPGGVTAKVYPHEDTSPRFPEILARAGVETVIMTEMPDVMNEYGVARGFTEQKGGRASKTVMSSAIERVKRQGSGPMFMYMHHLEAHAPYDRAGTSGTPFERYLRELALVDKEIGRLRAAIAEAKLEDRTAIILMADHGEAFGEHDSYFHGLTIYDEQMRVPLWAHVPGLAPRAVSRDVSLIDLGPTMLDLFGQVTPKSFMGQSLVPVLRGEDVALTRPIAMDTGHWQQAMLFPDHWKLIRDRRRGTIELYDLNKDPRELENLFDDPSSGAVERSRLLRMFFSAHTLRRAGYSVPYRP
jgi:arylsulfatase A-like enzyme